MNIIGNKIILRAIEVEDLSVLQIWANDPEIQYLLGGWHFPTSMNDQKKWLENLSCVSNNQRFMIVDKLNNIIGMANLININFKDGNAEHGLIIDKKYQGKGFGFDVVNAVTNYAFNELRLNRIETTIISSNINSIHLFENKCKWKKEGTLKQWYFRKGIYLDKYIYSMLKSDFKN